MEIKSLKCDVAGCCNKITEEKSNAGFPGWGAIIGVYDPATGADTAHLCPDCLEKVKEILNGSEV